MLTRQCQFALRHGKRLTTLVLVACLLAGGTGISVPVPQYKDTSVPFPCQDHGCSCRDARACWNNCCCFTPQQKLAWAQRKGVRPPDYVSAPGELATHEPTQPELWLGEFCELPQGLLQWKQAVCHVSPARQEGSCGSCKTPPAETTGANQDEADPYGRLSLVNDMQCRGLDSLTLFFAPVLEKLPTGGTLVAMPGKALPWASELAPLSWNAAPEPPPPRA